MTNTLVLAEREAVELKKSLAVFKDRLEIRSPGTLYGDLSFDDIRQGNVSRRRNPKIAELLRRIHLVEAWGRGVPLILENAPDANFIEIGGLFITRFMRPSALDAMVEASAKAGIETGRKTSIENPETSKESLETSRETSIESPETSRETDTEAVSPDALAGFSSAQKILLHLQLEPASTAKDLAQKIGITEKGVRYHLEQLKKQGKLRHVGPTKGGYWEVIGEDKQ